MAATRFRALVAPNVTVRVVVLLEEVDIDEGERERHLVPPRRFPLDPELTVEMAAIGDVREAVAVREVFELALELQELLLGALSLADVEHEPDERQRFRRRLERRTTSRIQMYLPSFVIAR